MLFSKLSRYLQKIEATDSRLDMTKQLAALFKESEANEIDKICYLVLGRLVPKFVGLELQLAEKMMVRVIAQVVKTSEKRVNDVFKNTGDLGEVFYTFAKQNPDLVTNKNLSISNVYERLVAIAKQAGIGSQERKVQGMVNLLQSVSSLGGKYLVRIPLQKLRLGFSDMTILDALSWMETGDKSLRAELEHAFNIRADIGQIARLLKEKGLKTLKGLTPETGTPIRPALSTPLLSKEEILERMDDSTFLEPKFDGFRVQVHIDKSKVSDEVEEETPALFEETKKAFVRIFSRNLDSTTHMFPDLVAAAQDLPVNSAILDGEAVAVDPSTGKLLDFQETVKRKRKHNIDQVKEEIPLQVFTFDILYLNGVSLVNTSQKDRRTFLEKVFKKVRKDSPFVLTEQRLVSDPDSFEDFFAEVAKEGLEGLMAKKVEAPYRAGKRDFTWVKYKVAMQSELADTVDAVVMGYFKGEGKWAKLGLGKVLVGIPHDGKIYSLSKVGSGFSEEKLKEMLKRCEVSKVKKMPKNYVADKTLIPDVWVKPEILIEIRADSISRSPIHETGLSLRFPRFIKFRDDKDVTEATTLEQVKQLAGSQKE